MSTHARWTLMMDRDDTFEVGFALGATLLKRPESPRVFAAIGDLGAGKTSLAQGLARGLGVPSDVYVNSPTFALHQAHQGDVTFHHLDLYRLMDEDELIHLGFEELLESGVSYIEWPQRAPHLLNATPHIRCELFYLDEWRATHPNLEIDSDLEDGRVLCLSSSSMEVTSALTHDERWRDALSPDSRDQA